MARMFIGNLTNQIQEFSYRLPERRSPVRITIPIGAQTLLSGDLTTQDIEAIIEHQAPYGFTPVNEIDRTRGFVGMCWQLDKKIEVAKLKQGIGRNFQILDARGRQIRSEAAIAITDQMANNGAPVTALEVTMQEVEAKDGPKEASLHEVVRVSATEDPGEGPRSTAAKKSRNSALT